MSTNSMFNPSFGGSNSGGGSGGTDVTVINNLTSTSTTSALSANMGRELNELLESHNQLKASDTDLGHVKVDGITIKSDADGTISISDGVGKLNYSHAILPTTVIDQQKWEIPFVDYEYPSDLLLVSYNSTFLSPDKYSVTRNSSDTHWELNIPNDSGITLPIDNNQVYVVAIKSAGISSGSGSIDGSSVLDGTVTENKLSQDVKDKLNSPADTQWGEFLL